MVKYKNMFIYLNQFRRERMNFLTLFDLQWHLSGSHLGYWMCFVFFALFNIDKCGLVSTYNLSFHAIMSLLEAPCAKTSWRALLFHAIFAITRALIVCFDIWRFKQANNSETCFGGHHCDFDQHVPCLTGHVCMNSVKFVLEVPGASILWEHYYSVTMCRLTWGHFY